MKQSDKQNARIEHDAALQRVMNDLLSDHTELFRQFVDNPQFREWLQDEVFRATYQELPRGTAVSDLLPFTRVMNPSDYYRTAVPLMTLEAAVR